MGPVKTMNSMGELLKRLLTRYPSVYEKSRMPYAACRFYLRKPHDRDYGAFSLFPGRNGLFLDVGANAGQSAFSFRIYCRENPILSLEPNPFHEADLKFASRIVHRHQYLLIGAGNDRKDTELFVPIYRGVPLTPEASLDREEVLSSKSLMRRIGGSVNMSDVRLEPIRVSIQLVDELNLSPDFVKLDLQGHEFAALQGMAQTLERSSPVMLIETPDSRCRELLASAGFSPYTFDQRRANLAPETKPVTNVVFLREDAWAEVSA